MASPALAQPAPTATWIEMGVYSGAKVYHSPAPVSGPHRRLWLKVEFSATQEGGYRSVAELMEVNCAGNQVHIMELIVYPDPNLAGAPHRVTGTPTPWADIRPETLNADVAKLIC